MKTVDLSRYKRSYKRANLFKLAAWYLLNIMFFKTTIPYPQALKTGLLRLFGSKIGKGLVIRQAVNIRYPWLLKIGDNVWIGEESWIDNLAYVKIGNNVCISQGAYLFTGNHNYKKETFDLMVKEIVLEDGVWVGTKATVCAGVVLRSHSVITAGSIATKDTNPYTIYQGIPAVPIRNRRIE